MTYRPRNTEPRTLCAGFTLIEMMVGITLGMLVLAIVTVIFINVSRNRHDMERTGRQIENGRYAIQLIGEDLINAGYFGEFDPRLVGVPASKPDPCSTDVADMKNMVMFHVQGYAAAIPKPSCLSDVKSNTSAIAIRRVSTCVADEVNCEASAANEIYFQSSLCNSELALPVSSRYIVAAKPSAGTSPFALNVRDCKTPSSIRKYVMHIYFIADNNNPGDGIPTLKRAELSQGALTIVPLVEGVDDLQFAYGIDSAASDGVPDAMTLDPGAFNGCASDPCYIANWVNTLTVKIHLLSRAPEATPGYQDTKTYDVGLASPVGPFNDSFKRHLYVETVRMNNPAGRRE